MRAFAVTLAPAAGGRGRRQRAGRLGRGAPGARAAQAVRRASAPGQAVLGYRDVDERRFQRARLQAIPRPRVVAFGSSRVMQISRRAWARRRASSTTRHVARPRRGLHRALVVLERAGRVPGRRVFSLDAGRSTIAR